MAIERDFPVLTYDQYLALPEGHYNLLEGILVVTPSPSPRHQTLQARMLVALLPFVEEHELGWVFGAPCDVLLRATDPAIVVQPDVLFVAKDGQAKVTDVRVDGPPDLVVEILSPGNIRLDSVKKRALYEQYGVREYWMILPDLDQVEVMQRGSDGTFSRPLVFESSDTLTTPLLDGFALKLARFFRET